MNPTALERAARGLRRTGHHANIHDAPFRVASMYHDGRHGRHQRSLQHDRLCPVASGSEPPRQEREDRRSGGRVLQIAREPQHGHGHRQRDIRARPP